MVVDGPLGDDQALGDLGVAQPFDQQSEDLDLARREAGGVRARFRPRATWHALAQLAQATGHNRDRWGRAHERRCSWDRRSALPSPDSASAIASS